RRRIRRAVRSPHAIRRSQPSVPGSPARRGRSTRSWRPSSEGGPSVEPPCCGLKAGSERPAGAPSKLPRFVSVRGESEETTGLRRGPGLSPATSLVTMGKHHGVLGLPDSISACLFALDGVLTDTAAVHRAAWGATFDPVLKAHAQPPFSDTDYEDY